MIRALYTTSPSRWVWSDRVTGEERCSIGYQIDCDETFGSMRLFYTNHRDGEKVPVDYSVALTTTRTSWGALRWWFTCPLVVGGRACWRQLYLPGGDRYFGCRNCLNLTYQSCNDSHKYDGLLGSIGALLGLSAAQARRVLFVVR